MVDYILVMNDPYIFSQISRHIQDLDPIRLVNHELNELSRSFLRDLILRKHNLDVSQSKEDMLCSHPGVVLSLAINRNQLIIANYLYNIRIKLGNIDHIFSTLKHCDAAVWLYQRYPKHFLHSWRHRVNIINSVSWLDRLDQVGVIPCQYIINRYFTGNYHIDILEWLLNKGYNPSSQTVDTIYSTPVWSGNNLSGPTRNPRGWSEKHSCLSAHGLFPSMENMEKLQKTIHGRETIRIIINLQNSKTCD